MLGQGAYGIVFKARKETREDDDNKNSGTDTEITNNSEYVAVKRIENIFETTITSRRTLRELKFLRHLSAHENILTAHDVYFSDAVGNYDSIYLVCDLWQTDLAVILRRKDVALTEDHQSFLMYQVLRGLKYIHSAGIIHRDVKPRNLLISADWDLVICDFGLARYVGKNAGVCSTFSGDEALEDLHLTEYVCSRWYRPPELLCGIVSRTVSTSSSSNGCVTCTNVASGDDSGTTSNLTDKSKKGIEDEKSSVYYSFSLDMWSAGCILGEILCKSVLFPGANHQAVLGSIVSSLGGPPADFLSNVTKEKARQFLIQESSKAEAQARADIRKRKNGNSIGASTTTPTEVAVMHNASAIEEKGSTNDITKAIPADSKSSFQTAVSEEEPLDHEQVAEIASSFFYLDLLRIPVSTDLQKGLVDLLQALLQWHPEKRLSAEESLKHRALTDLHCEEDEPDYETTKKSNISIADDFEFDKRLLTEYHMRVEIAKEVVKYNEKSNDAGVEDTGQLYRTSSKLQFSDDERPIFDSYSIHDLPLKPHYMESENLPTSTNVLEARDLAKMRTIDKPYKAVLQVYERQQQFLEYFAETVRKIGREKARDILGRPEYFYMLFKTGDFGRELKRIVSRGFTKGIMLHQDKQKSVSKINSNKTNEKDSSVSEVQIVTNAKSFSKNREIALRSQRGRRGSLMSSTGALKMFSQIQNTKSGKKMLDKSKHKQSSRDEAANEELL